MPSASRSTTPVGIDMDVVEGRYAELHDHTVCSRRSSRTSTWRPYFRGLPGDACTCLHLGYVTAGPDHLPLAGPRGDLRRGGRVRRPARPPPADRRRHLDRRVQPHRGPPAGHGGHRPQHRGAERSGRVTAVDAASRLDPEVAELAATFVRWLETGVRPEGLLSRTPSATSRSRTGGSRARAPTRCTASGEGDHPFRGHGPGRGPGLRTASRLSPPPVRGSAGRPTGSRDCRELLHALGDRGPDQRAVGRLHRRLGRRAPAAARRAGPAAAALVSDDGRPDCLGVEPAGSRRGGVGGG